MENNKKSSIKREYKNFFENYHYFENNLRYVKLSLTWFLLSLTVNILIGLGVILFSNEFIRIAFEFLFIGGTIASVATLIYLFFNVGILIGDIKVSRYWN